MEIQTKLLFQEDILDAGMFQRWTGETTVRPNVWGLNSEFGGLRFGWYYGADYASSGRVSHLALIILSFIIVPVLYMMLCYFSIVLAVIGVAAYIAALLYWVLFREIKYYRLTKSTYYNITNTDVEIVNKIYKEWRTLRIPIDEIKQIHLVPFKSEKGESGSIYLYLDRKIKTYNLTDKERSYKLVIERVEDYKNAYRILHELINVSK